MGHPCRDHTNFLASALTGDDLLLQTSTISGGQTFPVVLLKIMLNSSPETHHDASLRAVYSLHTFLDGRKHVHQWSSHLITYARVNKRNCCTVCHIHFLYVLTHVPYLFPGHPFTMGLMDFSGHRF